MESNMNKKIGSRLLTLFFGFSLFFCTSGFAEFSPLRGSSFAKENPKRLPFQKCVISDYLFRNPNLSEPRFKPKWFSLTKKEYWASPYFYTQTGGFIVGQTDYWRNFYPVLTCVSVKEQIAFQIPIELERALQFGPIGMVAGYEKLKFDPKQLNGKKLRQVYGYYQGGQAGLGALISGIHGVFMNPEKIQLLYRVVGSGSGTFFGYTQFALEEKTELNETEVIAFVRDPFLIKPSRDAVFVWDEAPTP